MGPDPFNMPSWGTPTGTQQLQQSVNQLAPLATTFSGPAHGVPIAQTVPQANNSGGLLSKFGHWLGGVAGGIGHIAEGAGSWLVHNGVQMAEAPFKFSYDVGRSVFDNYEQSHQINQLDSQRQNLVGMFQSGKITASEYKSGLQDIVSQQKALSDQINATGQRLQNAKQEGINTASAILAVLAGPAAGAIGAGLEDTIGVGATAKFLTSVNANALLDTTEQALSKVASDPATFARLPAMAQKTLQSASAEVLASSAGMTAGQIARATAVNVAIKYPIYYNYISSTGTQLYKELDQKKYGAATRTLAFNAVLLLSGGPMGWALKRGGGAIGAVAGRTFTRTSFLDNLSKGIGVGGDNMAGDSAGLFKAIQNLPVEERTQVVKQMSAVEATNLAAVGGDPAAAAMRVIKGMESYEGISMSQFTHEEALNNMVNFSKAQQLADETGKAHGLGAITVGRVDARALNEISAGLSTERGTADRLQAWETLKSQNLTKAWANNENFDRQIKALIQKYNSPGELDNAIRNIKAGFAVKGFPKKVAQQLSKMGYIPITPATIEAPFKEGAGPLVSKFAQANDNFFLKSVQPLPVLGFLGDSLTRLGLSPNASSERVYQMFNDNLAKGLQKARVVPKMAGEDAAQTTDTMIKQLSDYARNPTHGKLAHNMPISDLRMMTTADVKAALDVSSVDARAIQRAITSAYIKVPLVARGLGDKAVDLGYKLAGPIQRRYLRLQGAARFSFNPFFQYLRVVPKTEILSEFEGGGWISSVFQGQLKELPKIRDFLREGGFLERGGLGTVISGEATDFAGSMAHNLTKRLLPAQERSIAGLLANQAERAGQDWRTFIANNPQQVRDTIQMIAEYDKRSNFLNSPLARTLNVAFFPFRFETKVAMIMTRSLARTSLMTQVSVVSGLLRAHTWLNSPEGQAWYAHNADAIGLFEYITPVATLNQVFEALIPGHNHSLGNFGELGGLPFGWIPQILDAEGITHFNQPGVDAKTGQMIPSYVPATTKGQAAIAIQDMLGTLFSYPGAQMGLPSKTSIERTIALASVAGTKTKDLKLNTPSANVLDQQQQSYAQTIQALSNTSAKIPPQSPLNQTIPVKQPEPQLLPGKKGRGAGGGKLKKGQFKPALAPGQTKYGQL